MTNSHDPSDPANFSSIWHGIIDAWSEDDGTSFPKINSMARSVLRQATPVVFINGIAVLTIPTQWAKDLMEETMAEDIESVLAQVLGGPITLSVSIKEPEPTPPAAPSQPAPSQDFSGTPTGATPSAPVSSNTRGVQADRLNNLDQGISDTQQHSQEFRQPHTQQQSHQSSYDFSQEKQVYGPRGERLGPARLASRNNRNTTPTAQKTNDDTEPETLLNSKYTFDTFVIGGSNQFANAACRAVAESPARAYNPLFIWGESGLGKTHLLHAIGHYAKEMQPDMRVRYVSSEELTNDFINSIATDKREDFKRRYRNLDMLIVDDIQFLQGKESTQEEFFHTFNALHQADKQIVLSSDRPPWQLTTLEDRLRTRFEGGLITDVQTPDLETRMAILSKKAQAEGTDLPEDVLELIASRYETSIRELEGALIRVTAYCSLGKEPITLAAAEVALRDIMPVDDVQMTPQVIIHVVSSYFDLTVEEITGKGRAKRYVQARQIAMYLCRELTDLSLPKLGEEFGRDHTTVMHAERRIRKQLNENRTTFNEVQELTQRAKAAARG